MWWWQYDIGGDGNNGGGGHDGGPDGDGGGNGDDGGGRTRCGGVVGGEGADLLLVVHIVVLFAAVIAERRS